MIFDNWTFEADHTTAGTRTLSPVADGLLFRHVKEDPQQFFRLILDTEFQFIDGDYDYLIGIEEGEDRCEEITLTVTETESGFEWLGVLPLSSAKFDKSNRIIRIKPEPDDDYRCFLDTWEDTYSIFTYPSIDLTMYEGEIEIERRNITALADIENPPTPTNDGSDPNWQILILDASFALSTWAGFVVWVRQVITTTCSGGSPVEPAGSGWDLRVNDCAGSGESTYSKEVALIRNPDEEYIGTSTRRRTYNVVPGVTYDVDADEHEVLEIDNGIRLTTIINSRIASTCSLALKSNFLSYAAPGGAPSNDAYTASDLIRYLVLFQRSDVKRPGAYQNATNGDVSLKMILDGLWSTLRAYWWIEGSNLYIEHESNLSSSNGLDLTAPPYADMIAGLNQYERIDQDFPRQQVFNWDESYAQRDFDGVPLVFDNACAKGDEPISAPWSTDVNSIFARPDTASDAGFVLVAPIYQESNNYYLPTEAGALTGTELLNGHLAWANLQANYHQENRPFLAGTMNQAAHTFDSARPARRQSDIAVTGFTPALFDSYDPDDLVKTDLGWGEVAEASWDVGTQTLTLELKHE